MQTIIDYAKSMLNIPYIWGGKNPLVGLDCSGLAHLLLRSAGISPGEINAQGFYDWCLKSVFSAERDVGSLVFYGQSPAHITHVAILINQWQIIEAGGGDQTCVSPQAAAIKGAYVKISTVDHRKDLIGFFMPDWPDFVKHG